MFWYGFEIWAIIPLASYPPDLPFVRPCCCSRWQGPEPKTLNPKQGEGWGLGSCSWSPGGGGWGDHGVTNDTGPLLLLANGVPAPISTGHGIGAPVSFLQLPAAPPQWCSTVGPSPTWSAGPPGDGGWGPRPLLRALMLPSTSISLHSIRDCLQPPATQLLYAPHSSAGSSSQTPSDGSQSLLVRAE